MHETLFVSALSTQFVTLVSFHDMLRLPTLIATHG